MKSINKIFSMTLLALFLVNLVFIPLVTAHDASSPLSVDLIAGNPKNNGMDVGDVLVWNDGVNLYVKYTTTGGWLLAETHLEVAADLSGIPQTKKGNPIPGQFTYKKDGLGGAIEDLYVIPLADNGWSAGTDLKIAAHADVFGLCFGNIEALLPDQVTISVVVPGTDCYMDVTIDEDSFLDGAYCGWCIDTDHGISSPETYLADVYSSYEAAAASFVEYPENLDLINWIMNQGWVGQTSAGGYGTYTYGDVQRAIWALIDDEQGSTAELGPYDDDRVDEIIADALANGDGFVPGSGDLMGIMLIPLDGDGHYYVQYLIIGIELVCGDETAWAEGTQFPGKNWAMYFQYIVQ